MKVKRLTPTAILPTRATEGSAGWDLYADEIFTLNVGERRLVRTGIAIALPLGHEGQLRPRSGLAHKLGVTVINSPGTIDSDYRGEVMVNLWNTGSVSRSQGKATPVTFGAGERIAQLVIGYSHQFDNASLLEEVDDLDETARGAGGHGSTGR